MSSAGPRADERYARRGLGRCGPIATRTSAHGTAREAAHSASAEGRRYNVLIKAGFVAGLPERDYGRDRHRNLVYVYEAHFRRTIEKDDSEQLVELVRCQKARMAKLLTPVDDLELDFGAPGMPILAHLPSPRPDVGEGVLPAAMLAPTVLRRGGAASAVHGASRALVTDHDLTGRALRVTHDKRAGVVRVEPLGWSAGEFALPAYVCALAGDAGCRLLPDPRDAGRIVDD